MRAALYFAPLTNNAMYLLLTRKEDGKRVLTNLTEMPLIEALDNESGGCTLSFKSIGGQITSEDVAETAEQVAFAIENCNTGFGSHENQVARVLAEK